MSSAIILSQGLFSSFHAEESLEGAPVEAGPLLRRLGPRSRLAGMVAHTGGGSGGAEGSLGLETTELVDGSDMVE